MTNFKIQLIGWAIMLTFGILANWIDWCEIIAISSAILIGSHIIIMLVQILINWIKS